MILSSDRQKRADALYNIDKKPVADSASPLVQEGVKLVPSGTRYFSKSRPVWVYLQAYGNAPSETQPVLAYFTLYSGPHKIFQTAVLQARQIVNPELKTVPLSLQLSLGGVPPSRYDCQLAVLNPSERKASFWRSSIALVP